MLARFSGYWQLNCDFKVENKKSAGLHENLWKSLWFHLVETYLNLFLNLLFFCFDHSLTFAIQETKVESPLKWYKRLICPDSDSHKKALRSTFVIWFMLMCMSEYLSFRLTYLRLPIHDREKKGKFGFQGIIKDSTKSNSFLAELLHIRSTFSSCLAVLLISGTSEGLMTQWYMNKKKLNFHLSLV